MRVNVEKVSPVKQKINFELPADRVTSEIDKVFGEIRKHAAIKGFRKGKVPQALIEKHFSDKMLEDVLKNLINETFYKALYEHKIHPISQPVIESKQLKNGEPFTYSATVEVLPEIEVKDYLGLKLKKEQYVQSDDVINSRLKQMQESMGQLKPVEEKRPAAVGDQVTLDFTGSIGDKPIEGGSAEDYQLELGSNQFIPGFEEQLVGMQVGDEGPIKVSFPGEYNNKELAGKEASFAVKIKELKTKELPALDDDFAKQFGEFETLDQLKAKLAEVHKGQELERIEAELRERLVKALIEKNPIEVPDAMVDKQLQYMRENMKKRLSYQQLTLEMVGLDEEKFNSHYREEALTQVRGMLLLDAVAKKEALTVEEPELAAKIAEIATKTGQKPELVKKHYQEDEYARENLAAQLREDKALALMLEKAEVSEVSREKL